MAALAPQGAESALLDLAVAISILPGLFNGLAGNADGVLAAATVALGLIEQALVLGVGGNTTFDTGHASVLLDITARRAPTS